ncbi:acyl-CoA dehydrogenase family protein [Rhabdothermincola salaria]|uniref:acyl-CoA dehydrogenase family protein n=1 Tax=Rhabdothermincola salaria TaxID=2903142 RepID=UPI001E30D75F|nr:acyl-CoA dehydrogenase family protein [Rhabdothermincola salaria]MCD9624846.1 acyl-CoA/acyl-ACP dehydrogenase [Rhabdothermincola salaria]
MSVDLGLTDDQQAIAELFDGFFVKESPPEVARAAEPLGFDRDLWAKVIELGAPGMGVAEDAGGGGASLADLVVVAEAYGRAIAPVPLVEHAVAARAWPEADLVAGESIATVALAPAGPDGTWHLVPAGAVADVVVGVDGDEVVAVRSTPPGEGPLNHAAAPLADRSARQGERTVLGPAGDAERLLAEWKVLTAAALVGIADQAMRMGVSYVMERQQFGVPIGSFQSVQHGLADLPVLVDGGRMLAHKAAWAAALEGDEAGLVDIDRNDVTDPSALASMAFVFAGDAASTATHRSLHYHGGYGFAEEYDIQLYYRRARGWRLVAGDPAQECLGLADRLFGHPGGVA